MVGSQQIRCIELLYNEQLHVSAFIGRLQVVLEELKILL